MRWRLVERWLRVILGKETDTTNTGCGDLMPRKAKQLGKGYKGALNKPTRRAAPPKPRGVMTKILLPEATDTYQEEWNRWFGESVSNVIADQVPKLMLLMDHYDIARGDPERWFLLALALARNHVPGFRIEDGNLVGRKESWDVVKDTLLYISVIEKIHAGPASTSRTISWACEQVAKDSLWKDSGLKKKSLQNRYPKAEKSILAQIYIGIVNKIANGDHRSDFAINLRSQLLQSLKPSR